MGAGRALGVDHASGRSTAKSTWAAARAKVDWAAVRQVCPYEGADLQAIVERR
jgi:hypothetical protein